MKITNTLELSNWKKYSSNLWVRDAIGSHYSVVDYISIEHDDIFQGGAWGKLSFVNKYLLEIKTNSLEEAKFNVDKILNKMSRFKSFL